VRGIFWPELLTVSALVVIGLALIRFKIMPPILYDEIYLLGAVLAIPGAFVHRSLSGYFLSSGGVLTTAAYAVIRWMHWGGSIM
jgi:hypothetical protein